MNPDKQKLLSGALKILSLRPRSRQEIVQHLSAKTQDSGLIEEIILQLEKSGYINDAQFTAWLVESRSRHKPRGKRVIEHELKLKGISSQTINDNLVAIDEKSSAIIALRKKLPLLKKLPYRDYRLKATRYLASRGFSWSVIEEVVKIGYNEEHVN